MGRRGGHHYLNNEEENGNTHMTIQERLTTFLVETSKCDTIEEAIAVATDLMETCLLQHSSCNNDDKGLSDEMLVNILKQISNEMVETYNFYENEDVAYREIRQILLQGQTGRSGLGNIVVSNEMNVHGISHNNDSSTDDNSSSSSFLEESLFEDTTPEYCELCERDNIRLTKHHLIPKVTWSKVQPRIIQAYYGAHNTHGNEGPSSSTTASSKTSFKHNEIFEKFNHVIQYLKDHDVRQKSKVAKVKDERQLSKLLTIFLSRNSQNFCFVCRPCHSMIHKTYDNMVLAYDYNTIQKLLNDPQLFKHGQWANKQRCGKYSNRHQEISVT